jgi:P-type Cu+ transporter
MNYSCPMHPEVEQDKPGSCPICGMALENPLEKDSIELNDMSKRLWICIFLTLPVIYLAMFEKPFPWIQALLTTPVVCWGGLPFFLRGWKSLIRLKLNMFTLISIGIGAAYIYSLITAYFSRTSLQSPHIYFEAASVITVLTILGQVLELQARNKTGAAIYKLLKLSPKRATLIQENKGEIDIPLEKVQKGNLLRVKPGEKIPTDGVIIEGSGSIDESMITGESFLVSKSKGDAVIGATLNENGSFIMKAEKVGKETLLSRIVKKVSEAQRSRAPIQKLADIVASYFVPIVILIAVITFFSWGFFVHSFTFGLINAISVLIIACPCALGLATPMSLMVGIGEAALNGIFIKDGSSLETLSKVDTLVLDKTGTLTEGKPKVTKIICLSGSNETEVIQLAASLEIASHHPLAIPIVEKAREQNVSLLDVEDFQDIRGKGVSGKIQGKSVVIGNEALLSTLSVTITDELEQAKNQHLLNESVLYLALDKKVIGFFTIADQIKETTKTAIDELHKAGLEVIMLTGDRRKTALEVGKALNIDTVEAEVLPEDKGDLIKNLQNQGKTVAMVGDGVNDALALAVANVGIAMGRGSDIAIESASITLLKGDLRSIIKARELSLRTMRNIKQNLCFAFAYNTLGIPIAAGVFFPLFGIMLSPIIASTAMMLSSLSIILNALRLKKRKQKLSAFFSFPIIAALLSFFFLVCDIKSAPSYKEPLSSVKQMLNSKEKVINITKLKGGCVNHIWDVQTIKSRYVLREKIEKIKNASFIKDLEMAQKASVNQVGPRLFGFNLSLQQMLLKYIEGVRWPTLEINIEPYKKTMQVLREFHEKMPIDILEEKGGFAPFDFIFFTGAFLEKGGSVPSHFSLALKKMESIFLDLEPWLKKNAKLCHGDFTKHNVLLSKDGTPILIDFDSTSVGDPLFDVVKFCLPFSYDQRLDLFKAYLGNEVPSIEELSHFEAMDLSMLMLVASLRFQSSLNTAQEEILSVSEMESILDSKEKLPSFLDIPFENTSAKARQLGALYALSEFLSRS